MIIVTEELKKICEPIKYALDDTEQSQITEVLELVQKGKFLHLNVTNKEYYVNVKLAVNIEDNFHATINAIKFLKLISQTTAESVELIQDDKYLYIKGNGDYKLPLIYDDDKVLELPEINIGNVNTEFDISTSILSSIFNYNSKELQRAKPRQPIQRYYYVDNDGAITFTSGACVNSFTLTNPVKMLLNQKLVKLFRLFKTNQTHFVMGHDEVDGIIQTKVKFEDSNISITSILYSDESLLNSFPVEAIRNSLKIELPYSITLNKNIFLSAINRISIFSEFTSVFTFDFDKDTVTIHNNINQDSEESSCNEVITYENHLCNIDSYSAKLDIKDILSVLSTCSDDFVVITFGNNRSFNFVKNNIIEMIPECHNG